MLTPEERDLLLGAARSAVRSAVLRAPEMHVRTKFPALGESRGAFVTLWENDELRGCIGYVDGIYPLVATIERAARMAATEDNRFSPVTEAELPRLEIEISVLSPLEEFHGPEEIVIGMHGVVVETEHHRGLLLPQVAAEHGWDQRTLLEHASQKAGLPRQAWQSPGVRLYRFTAEVFRERSTHEVS